MPKEHLLWARLCMTFRRNGKPPERKPRPRNAHRSFGEIFSKKRPACGLATISPNWTQLHGSATVTYRGQHMRVAPAARAGRPLARLWLCALRGRSMACRRFRRSFASIKLARVHHHPRDASSWRREGFSIDDAREWTFLFGPQQSAANGRVITFNASTASA